MDRIVRVWIGNDFLDVDLELDEREENLNEDELYESVVDYIFSNISIELI